MRKKQTIELTLDQVTQMARTNYLLGRNDANHENIENFETTQEELDKARREHFAGIALQAILTNMGTMTPDGDWLHSPVNMVDKALWIADLMIEKLKG